MDGEIWYAHDGHEAAFTVALPAIEPAVPLTHAPDTSAAANEATG